MLPIGLYKHCISRNYCKLNKGKIFSSEGEAAIKKKKKKKETQADKGSGTKISNPVWYLPDMTFVGCSLDVLVKPPLQGACLFPVTT